MTISAEPDGMEEETDRPSAPRRGIRRAIGVVLAVLVVVVVGFFGITALTGFPGPGPLRRYPASDLNHLADRINAQRGVSGRPAGASVDLLRSRVSVRGLAVWCSTTPLSPTDAQMLEVDPEPARHSCAPTP